MTLVVFASNGFLKRYATVWMEARDNPWADWQLPVRIGDNIDAVRATGRRFESDCRLHGYEESAETGLLRSMAENAGLQKISFYFSFKRARQ